MEIHSTPRASAVVMCIFVIVMHMHKFFSNGCEAVVCFVS